MGDCAFGGWEVPALSCNFKVYDTLVRPRSPFFHALPKPHQKVGDVGQLSRFAATLPIEWNDLHQDARACVAKQSARAAMIRKMSRSERLLALLQVLRRHRLPVSGWLLAQEVGVSIRTLYRDIATLQAQGATIEGSPGIGYVMKPGFMLPPLMFQQEEIEALALGARWVAEHGDHGLSSGARDAIAKIAAVLPSDMRRELEASALLVGVGRRRAGSVVEPDVLRAAVRSERKLRITYRDPSDNVSRRVVWPFAIVYFDQSRVLSAWCELRSDFRNFRADRIDEAALLEKRYPRRRQVLLREWRHLIEAAGRDILPETDIMSP